MAQSRREKASLDLVLHLVEQLPADAQEELRVKLNRKAQSQSSPDLTPNSFIDWRIDLDALAERQGVKVCNSLNELKGDFWPEDEDIDEFVSTVRQWRRESRER